MWHNVGRLVLTGHKQPVVVARTDTEAKLIALAPCMLKALRSGNKAAIRDVLDRYDCKEFRCSSCDMTSAYYTEWLEYSPEDSTLVAVCIDCEHKEFASDKA